MTFSFYKWFKNLSLVFAFAFASNAAQAQYCNTGLYTTACFWGDQIEAFATTGGTTNISNWYSGCGNSSGYTYYSTQTVTIAAGGTVGFSILNNYYYGQYYKVWVDFNGDGDFYDSGEQLYSAYLNYYAFVSSSFVVPNGTTPGTKRLRVRCSYYGTSSMDPCAQETYGEVEDYNLVVTGSAACSGTPAPGNTISTANPVCAGTSFTLSLQNTTSGSGVSYQWQSSPNNTTWTNVSGATANTLSTTQTASTYYRCAVTCSSNTGFSNSLQVTMNNFLNCYCVAGNSNGCGFSDVITNVTFGTINNTTGCTATPAYIDYGGSVAAPNITIGATTPISVTVGPGGTERVAAWIDYNQNGIFETTEYTSIGSGNGVTISNNITVPGTALPGTTKMRVRVRYNTTIASNEACSTFTYGETEDYNLNMICVSPTITAHPASTSFCSGANTSFTATATGSAISYQWQVNTGSGYTNISNGGVYGGATASTLSLTAPPASFSGYTYRCVATAACNSATATTSDAVLTIAATTAVTAPPTNTTVCPGANTTLTVGAVGSSLTYQWQIGTPSGGAYYNLTNTAPHSNVNTSTLNITGATVGMDGNIYRCVVSGTCGTYTTAAVLLNVNNTLPVTGQPVNTTVCQSANSSFSVVTGGSNVVYQWQVNTGSGFANVSNTGVYSGATAGTLNISGTPLSMNGYQYRCEISNSCVAPFLTNTGTLTVNPSPVITSQPTSVVTCDWQNPSFTVGATGTGISYQWQVNMGGGFANVTTSAPYSGTTSPTLSILNVSGAYNGYIYRCVITGACAPAVTTNNVTLTVNTRPFIIAHPLRTATCEGTAVSLTTVATGTGMSYQWQVNTGGGYVNVNNGGVVSGATSATLAISNAAVSMHGNHYRCVLTGICAPVLITNEAVLLIQTAATITSHPTNKVNCVGSNAIFNVGGTTPTNSGNGLSYQWQVNTGTGYTNLSNAAPYSGVTTASLLVSNIQTSMNGYLYRCAVTSACTPTALSTGALLNVETLPTIITHPQDITICPGSNGSFIVGASGSGLLYQWQVNDGSGYVNIPGSSTAYNGMNNAMLNVLAATPSMHGYQYRCRVSGNCAPAVISAVGRLYLHNPVTINTHSNIDTVCEGKVARLGVKATGGGLLYQWQRRQPDGTYADLMNIPPYSGVNTDSLRISGTPAGLNGSIYRCAITETVLCGLWYYTGDIPLTVNAAPASSPAKLEITQFGKGIFSVPAGASKYQWQENDNSGGGYRDLTDGGSYKGAYTNTLTIDPVSVTMTGNMYRCIIDGICTSSVTSQPSELIINPSLGIGNKQLVAGGITIYPNPLSGSELSVRFDKVPVGSTEVKVLDKLGKVVYTGTLEVNNSKVGVINLHSLAAGVYMLQVMNADANIAETIQFTKQ